MSDTKGAAGGGGSEGFSEEERAAMKARARELKAQGRRGGRARDDGLADLLAKIAELPEPDRTLATRIHELVMEAAPELAPRTWYGSPAYAKDGKIICFFQPAALFKTRYTTFAFNDAARLDDGELWATAFAVRSLNDDVEQRIAALVTKAVG